MLDESHSITLLLHEWRAGNQEAGNRILELTYAELRQIASRNMRREREGHTLQTTAIVHEAYLRLCGAEVDWRDKSHFLAVAAQQLRRVLVDHARSARSEKRGGGHVQQMLGDFNEGGVVIDERVLAVDQALKRLELLDARAAKVVELRFFGGLSEADAAEILDISVASLKRDWKFAKTWLASQL
jgi:RNA polymerase sigma-70 factor, ECF subfamily